MIRALCGFDQLGDVSFAGAANNLKRRVAMSNVKNSPAKGMACAVGCSHFAELRSNVGWIEYHHAVLGIAARIIAIKAKTLEPFNALRLIDLVWRKSRVIAEEAPIT